MKTKVLSQLKFKINYFFIKNKNWFCPFSILIPSNLLLADVKQLHQSLQFVGTNLPLDILHQLCSFGRPMVLLPRPCDNLPSSEVTVVLEVATILVTEKTEVTDHLANAFGVSFVVCCLIVQFVPQCLHLRSLLQITKVMIERAIGTSAGTVEVTRLRHNLC